MKGYIGDIERLALENEHFRVVLYTATQSQLVVMSLKPGEDIGNEIHDVDQFIRCEQGTGTAILDGVEHEIKDGFAVVIPAGVKHNIINTSNDAPLKLYSLYAPPHHKDAVRHVTKQQAEADDEHFDGVVTE